MTGSATPPDEPDFRSPDLEPADLTNDQLLAMAVDAMDDYDVEDGKPINCPEWRLLVAVEQLRKNLAAGGPLPAVWRTEHRR